MAYAIFSKRTRIISRIVNDLTSLLPSESMIEIDEEANYPKEISSLVQGQDMNTYNTPLFTEGGTPTTKLSRVTYDGVTDRPKVLNLPPRFVLPTVPGGERKRVRKDIPIVSHPFGWKAEQVFVVKYESILAQNAPYEVLIGEEFFNDDHIDTGASSDYVLTEGTCTLAPGGIVVTDSFSFNIAKNTGGTTLKEASSYVFDTYYLETDPDTDTGIDVYWRGVRYSNETTTNWHPVMTNREVPTTEVADDEAAATHLKSIQLRFVNQTSGVFSLENYLLFLRLRKTIIQTPTP